MRVEARTTVRAAVALVTVILVAATVACGGGPSQQQAAPAAAAPPAPKVLTAAERATWYQDCWTQFNNKAWDPFKGCYADTVESDQVDSGQPAAKGIEALLASTKMITGTFPDMKGTGELILINGDTIVSVYVINATHTGALTGPGGQSIPATNKPIGYLQAHLAQTDATGGKVVKEEFYSDSGTMMAQLGISPAPARPVMASTTAAPKVIVAGGTPAEMSNVETSRVQMAAFNSHNAKGVDTYNAADSVYHDMAMPKDQNSKENLAGTLDMFKAFPDAKLATSSIWAAGDYVVVTGRFEGTNKGPMAALGIKKATGKSVSVRYLDIARWEGGKIKEEWLFYNGMAFATQLGMVGK
jgi:predicted ester cyclase